ncbi:hypothetical protein KR018_004814 [Drosophila ironensis]|nr:hypothetical protein KR018_004814 [Drosophila ironensis]
MATKQPTPRQLAYLDELKTRLRELRERQVTFMEQTAQMLSRMSSASLEEAAAVAAVAAVVPADLPLRTADGEGQEKSVITMATKPGSGKLDIKKLIQRFEDLRKTSQEFEELPEVPEELVNVDVRRILKGYEKLIEDGNVLQESWFLLKKTTESCARLTKASFKDDSKKDATESPTDKESPETITDIVTVKKLPGAEPSPKVIEVPRENDKQSLYANVITTTTVLTDKSGKQDEWHCPARDYGKQPARRQDTSSLMKPKPKPFPYPGPQRWGAFIQLFLRAVKPFRRGRMQKKTQTEGLSDYPSRPIKTPTN